MQKALFRGSFILLVLLLVSSISYPIAFAAMDPDIVRERHEEAPYHIRGTIISDELYQDITTEDKYPTQLRRMAIQVDEVMKAPSDLGNVVEVIYHYTPSWNELEYVGGKRMDVVVNDVVEIWLNDAEHGLEPMLGGYSVHHMHYEEDRRDHIPEPFWHGVVRKLESLRDVRPDIFIISGLVMVVGWAIFRGLSKTGSYKN